MAEGSRAAAEARSQKMAKAAPARRETRSQVAANQKAVVRPDQVAAVKPADPEQRPPVRHDLGVGDACSASRGVVS